MRQSLKIIRIISAVNLPHLVEKILLRQIADFVIRKGHGASDVAESVVFVLSVDTGDNRTMDPSFDLLAVERFPINREVLRLREI